MSDPQPHLVARDLEIERAGRVLFTGLSLRVESGDLVHLRGANGAGKTTLLRMLAGLALYGYEGELTRQSPPLFLGHQAGIKALLTVRENLLWHPSGEAYGEPGRIDAALGAIGLYGYEDVPVAQLSAGQQRRVNLARLFLSQRSCWLLDEPFTAIDATGVQALTRRMDAHVAQGGSVLFTSHQPLASEQSVREIDLADFVPALAEGAPA